MTEECLECDSFVVPGSRFHSNLMKALRSVKRRAMWFWIIINLNSVAYTLMPFFIPGRHLPEDLLIIYGTPSLICVTSVQFLRAFKKLNIELTELNCVIIFNYVH